MNILHELNAKQKEAVTHKEGPLLVIAGPGTGKTEVIIRRIGYLIRHCGIKPEQILALTFTNAASQEMRKNVNKLVGSLHGSNVRISNFHSFCVSTLRTISNLETQDERVKKDEILIEVIRDLNLNPHFTIFDQEIQDEILTEVIRDLNLNFHDYPPWWLRHIIRKSKCTLQDPIDVVDPEDLERLGTLEHLENVLQVYQCKLNEYNGLDFDDLFVKTIKLLDRVPKALQTYHQEISHILVDEFHDVNRAQYCLLQLLCSPLEQNLMVVADKNQDIDHWRWSNAQQYIEAFKTDFTPQIIELNEHYRCSKKILYAAQKVITRDPEYHKHPTLSIHKDAGRDIFHYTFDTPIAEARYITKIIQNLVTQRSYSYRDIAVFYRTDELADVLAGQLLQTGINFIRSQPTNFKKEEKHREGILSYLRFIQWKFPHDLERAINFPEIRIDDLTLARLKHLAQREHIEFMELLKNIEAYPQDVGPLTRRNVRQFWTQLENLSTEIKGEKIDRIVSKLFGTLELARSPYRAEELEVIEKQPELSNLSTAQDVLYSALNFDEPIQITASYGTDEYCAAHIIHRTLETYLNHTAQFRLLSSDENRPLQVDNGVHLLIGNFDELGEKGQNVRTILIGTSNAADSDVIRLEEEEVRSIAALKLCQRLISRFEIPNMRDTVIYDFETTGLDLEEANIVQIAALHFETTEDPEDNTIKDIKAINDYHKFDRLVKPPGGHIPRSATRVHGIKEEDVKNAPGIDIVLPELLGFIQDRILVGHNITEFDNPIFDRDLRRYLKRELSTPHYDTLVTARRLFPRERCSIGALADKFKIKYKDLHNALEDVRVNREIFKELVKIDADKRKVKSLTELLPLVGIGILAKRETLQLEIAPIEETEIPRSETIPTAEVLTEVDAFLKASIRFVQTHRPSLRHHLPLDPVEKERVSSFINQLKQSKTLTVLPEDATWKKRHARFMNEVSSFKSIGMDYQRFLNSLEKDDTDSEHLRLMKLHTARGKEFPVVIIIGMEQESFPIWKKDLTQEEIEAERRLFYVGMTRAQEQLYLSTSKYRFGDRDRASSMFVREIPPDYVVKWSPQDRV